MNRVGLIFSALTLSLLFSGIGSFVFSPNRDYSFANNAASTILHTDISEATVDDSSFVAFDKLLDGLTANVDPVATTTAEETPDNDILPASTTDHAKAVAKIRCVQTTDDYKRSISGTGFIIDPKGIILTNAHVAQFLLLEDADIPGETECTATVGNSEEPVFALELLYISPSWLLKHASLIDSSAPKGTGESDFAIAYISGLADGSAMNETFPYIPPATNSLSKSYQDKVVTVLGYPRQPDKTAPLMTATTTITKLYTFGSGYADIFSLAASTLGHQGSSGGPVVDDLGRAIGMLTTKDQGTTILNAITMAHIDRRLLEEVNFDLASYVSGDIMYKAQMFNKTVAPILQEILSGYLR